MMLLIELYLLIPLSVCQGSHWLFQTLSPRAHLHVVGKMRFMSMTTNRFMDRAVKVPIHKPMNSSRGIIRWIDLAVVSDLEIKDELRSQGVVEVGRMMVRWNGVSSPTTLFLSLSKWRPCRKRKKKISWSPESDGEHAYSQSHAVLQFTLALDLRGKGAKQRLNV